MAFAVSSTSWGDPSERKNLVAEGSATSAELSNWLKLVQEGLAISDELPAPVVERRAGRAPASTRLPGLTSPQDRPAIDHLVATHDQVVVELRGCEAGVIGGDPQACSDRKSATDLSVFSCETPLTSSALDCSPRS